MRVVILEVQWGAPQDIAPAFFRINPRNHTGARLIDWFGHDDFIVTNACREVVSRPQDRGTPDPARLRRNLLSLLRTRVLLVCGNTARHTYQRALVEWPMPPRVLYLPHPACRWSAAALVRARSAVRLADQDEGPMEVVVKL